MGYAALFEIGAGETEEGCQGGGGKGEDVRYALTIQKVARLCYRSLFLFQVKA
jgi:hypothetical protein